MVSPLPRDRAPPSDILGNSGLDELSEIIQHFQSSPASYRQLGAGGPLRMITDPSQPRIFDAFGRDERAPDRRSADKLGIHIDKAEDAIVSLVDAARLES